jgi:hypothetical protein
MANVPVKVDYPHRSEDLQTIYLAVTDQARPASNIWRPAFRDIDRTGKKPRRIVFAYFPSTGRMMKVWIRDSAGDRPLDSRIV